ncbi:conserved hypothetical protein [Oleispira antarctica RB-8]|uniref:Lipoprotein n=1 Tax=Oleispira antarctica RB-8 TaxID=698738 RepID=R4YLR1_OLEAN|nr:conserved hypothetical protein [Oleispira antarctica RB-8]
MSYRAPYKRSSYSKRAIIFCLTSVLLISLTACKFNPLKTEPEIAVIDYSQEQQDTAQQRAQTIFQQYYQYQIDSSPVLRSTLAMPGQYEWDDISMSAQQEYIETIQDFRQQLIELEQGALSTDDRLSYELLLHHIEQSLLFTPFEHHDYALSQMGGWHTRIPNILINYQSINNIQEAHDYIERINGVRHLFSELINRLEQAEAAGIIAPQFVYPYVISAAQNVITGAPFNDEGNSPIWEDFNKKIEGLNLFASSDKVLLKKAQRALKRSLLPAYNDLISFLQQQALRAPKQQAAKDLPQGEEYYQLLLQSHTTTNLSAEQIHQLGLKEVARIQNKIRTLIKPLGYPVANKKDADINALDLKAFFTWMEDNAERFEQDPQGEKDFIAYQRDKVAAISMRLHKSFLELPKTPIVVRAVDKYRQPSSPVAFYEQPPLDGSRPGFYYVNPARQHDLPKYRLAALAYHEALPGHHLQIALARENQNLPSFRRLMSFTAFSEGWALYAEKLADEMGGYTSNEERYGQLIMELWRAVRLVLDTGLHSKGWSKEQALEYRLANTPFSEQDSIHAIERYLVMPGQATSYKIGALEIERLRHKAKKTLGRKFSLPEFHQVILEQGALPLDILEQQVDQWLERKNR